MNESVIGRHLRHMRRARLSQSYIRRRISTLTSITAVIGKHPEKATRKDLLRWHDSLQMSPESVLVLVGHARRFYAWLAEEGIRSDNPAANLERPRRATRIPRPITEPDLMRALAAAPPRERMMLVLAAWLGLRCCEIAGLRWESIAPDDARPMLFVTWQTAKGRRERAFELSPWLVAEFQRYGIRPSGWVIPRIDGQARPNTPARISRLISEYLHSQNIDATAHQGRHRFATQILDNGGDVLTVKEALGHADLSNVQVYTLVRSAAITAAIAALPVPAEALQNAS